MFQQGEDAMPPSYSVRRDVLQPSYRVGRGRPTPQKNRDSKYTLILKNHLGAQPGRRLAAPR